MPTFEYLRPKTIEEAVSLLARGVPLAGGTRVSTKRRKIEAAVDLRDLGLTDLKIDKGAVTIEAGVSLQAIVASKLPAALQTASRLEAGRNIRNAATLGGLAMAGNGRSPLLTTLLALDASVNLEPKSKELALEKFLITRDEVRSRQLLTSVRFDLPLALVYEQVARSPVDRPIVCVAVAQSKSESGSDSTAIAIGGYGEYPLRAKEAEKKAAAGEAFDAVAQAAASLFEKAEDDWASAAYRTAVVGVLVKRLLAKGGA